MAQLNPAQAAAVESDAQHLLVLAGAGSGKTRVLTQRIAWLLETGASSAWSVMAVTFTNKAAREMRGRIEAILPNSTQGMWIGTFHGIANRLLRQYWQIAKLPENFIILDSDDQIRLLRRIIAEARLDEKKFPAKQVAHFISEQKDEGRRAAHVPPSFDPYEQQLVAIYEAYEQVCQQQGVVDFGELLLRALELVRDNPDVAEALHKRFRYLLVDEFQDTNAVQFAWLRLMSGESGCLTVVGDDDQSIYGWRGARIENIRDFNQTFPGADTVRLEQNYRSTNIILKAANHIIANNTGRLGKDLWADSGDGERIKLYTAFNEQEEGSWIAEQIQALEEEGNNWDECAILYRSNAQSRVLEEALLRRSIPYRIYGGMRFYERAEIKHATSYLRLLHYRHDNVAFERVVNFPTRGMGDKSLQKVRDLAQQAHLTMWDAACLAVDQGVVTGKARTGLHGFIHLIDSLADAPVKSLEELTQLMLDQSGLLDAFKKEKGEKGEARVDNLQELVGATKSFEIQLDDPEADVLAAFLDEVSLNAGDQQAEEDESAVQLMTLHSAKGLEFPYVFLVGMEEGLFPHKMSMESADGLEEERRLCYVGITRAEKQLTLTQAESRRLWGKEQLCRPSRFIRELPSELLHDVRMGVNVSRPMSVQRPVAPDGFAYRIGQAVRHSKFGEGIVTNVDGSDAQARVEVHFDDAGAKWLMVQFAKLEVL